MAESILKNYANVTGLYGEDECSIEFSSNEVSTTIIRGLTALKEADKTCWVDGPLTYTITVKNNTDTKLTNGIMTDYLDTNLSVLDEEYGILVNGTLSGAYSYFSGILSVNLPEMEADDEVVIKFRIMQV